MICLPRHSAADLLAGASIKGRRAHLIGAAGSGMRSLAAVLSGARWTLSGSDDRHNAAGRWPGALRRPAAENVRIDHELVIYSDAVACDHPERQRASALGIPAISYPQAVGCLMATRRGIAVAGTHGKSTTSAMLSQILDAAGLDPTFVFGAEPLGGAGGRLGRGPWMVAEACEYRENFRHLRPELAVVLNIEADHFDYYHRWPQLTGAFGRFLGGVAPQGRVLYSADCPTTGAVAGCLPVAAESFGLSDKADWQARIENVQRGQHQFSIWHRGRTCGVVRLQVAGRHSVLNALAAAVAAHHVGASWRAICEGLESFAGLRRRLEVVVDTPRLAVVDDYAHLPTEISAGLATVRQRYPGRRVWCVFEPHQASRTACLLDELAASLQNADTILVAEIFRARESAAVAGEVTASSLAERARRRGARVLDMHDVGEIEATLMSELQAGDVLVTMGAGNIGKIAHGIAERF